MGVGPVAFACAGGAVSESVTRFDGAGADAVALAGGAVNTVPESEVTDGTGAETVALATAVTLTRGDGLGEFPVADPGTPVAVIATEGVGPCALA